MLLIRRPDTDPYFNLAAEEYLLKSTGEDLFMAWRNKPCIVVGKHQNTSREVNHEFALQHKLPVIRRISGGGAVYHDPGNINFSFIFTGRKENPIDFRLFTRPVIGFLSILGLDARLEGKSSLVVGDVKISGNAAHIYRDKVLYHGTLLVNTDLEVLEQALNGRETNYHDRAVRSVKARVGNLSALLEAPMDVRLMIKSLYGYIQSIHPEAITTKLLPKEKEAIGRLAQEKYHSTEWNYRYSPAYSFSRTFILDRSRVNLKLEVKNGLILKIRVKGPPIPDAWTRRAEEILLGQPHEKKPLSRMLAAYNFVSREELDFLNQISLHLF